MKAPTVNGPALRPYRVILRRGAATLEQTVFAVDAAEARGACAFQERDGWVWVRTEAV